MAEVIVATLGLAAAALSVAYSLGRTFWKAKAESELVEQLRREVTKSRLIALEKQLAAEQQDVKKVYELYRQIIEEALSQLDESKREKILEGLNQPSLKGRSEYLRKLLKQTTGEAVQAAF